jgi:hypothetical protein
MFILAHVQFDHTQRLAVTGRDRLGDVQPKVAAERGEPGQLGADRRSAPALGWVDAERIALPCRVDPKHGVLGIGAEGEPGIGSAVRRESDVGKCAEPAALPGT